MKKKTYQYQVLPQEVDFQKEITFVRLSDCILTSAGRDATDNGFGMQELNAINATWVLAKIAIEIAAPLPEFRRYAVETWIDEVGRSSSSRNFRIVGEGGEMLGGAVSNWAMMNIDTRRPIDLQSLDGFADFAQGGGAVIEPPAKRLPDIAGESVSRHTIKYSDIDMTGHVNSASYLQWLCDLFDKAMYAGKFIRRVELNYINESFWGERIEIFREERAADDFFFELKRGDKTICKARIAWAGRDEKSLR